MLDRLAPQRLLAMRAGPLDAGRLGSTGHRRARSDLRVGHAHDAVRDPVRFLLEPVVRTPDPQLVLHVARREQLPRGAVANRSLQVQDLAGRRADVGNGSRRGRPARR
jgi:hypothetical protein